MDNYPSENAPVFEDGGAVKTPFEEWWALNATRYPNVPECVARQWLHRHWGHSPYDWMPSKGAKFALTCLDEDMLERVIVDSVDRKSLLWKGREHIENSSSLWVPRFMRENRTFPVPIIILDDSNGKIRSHVDNVPEWAFPTAGLYLLEGHTRFECAVYLASQRMLDFPLPVWKMSYAC